MLRGPGGRNPLTVRTFPHPAKSAGLPWRIAAKRGNPAPGSASGKSVQSWTFRHAGLERADGLCTIVCTTIAGTAVFSFSWKMNNPLGTWSLC